MTPAAKPRLLVNLPASFFSTPAFQADIQRLGKIGNLRTRSYDTLEEMLPDLRWARAVIMWAWPNLTQEALADCPDLQFVGALNTTQATAHACFQRGIALSEVRHCWSPAVAEMALGLILDGLRQISAHHLAMRDGTETWVETFPEEIDPRERQLSGREVGIIGFGQIGRRLAQLLGPFQVRLRIYDPYVPKETSDIYQAESVSLDDLIASSDVVVLCAANNEGSRHLLGSDQIAALRKDAVLINVGRSMLVDMAALAERLAQGDLIALLDVFDEEPLAPDSPLRSLPNAYLSPHRAGGIHESVHRALTWLADDLESFLAGQTLKYALTERMLTSLSE